MFHLRRKHLLHFKRLVAEFFGITRWSRPARHNLDNILSKYLPESGFFIEAGANDGFTESNTYYLEKILGWKGILIEPIPELFEECRKERKASEVINCALVNNEYKQDKITMVYANLMSTTKSNLLKSKETKQRLEKAKSWHKPYEIDVEVRTLKKILLDRGIKKIDFLSLDVEGFEFEVLKGLDLEEYHPEFILIEILYDKNFQNLNELLTSNKYILIDKVTERDYLYKFNN